MPEDDYLFPVCPRCNQPMISLAKIDGGHVHVISVTCEDCGFYRLSDPLAPAQPGRGDPSLCAAAA